MSNHLVSMIFFGIVRLADLYMYQYKTMKGQETEWIRMKQMALAGDKEKLFMETYMMVCYT